MNFLEKFEHYKYKSITKYNRWIDNTTKRTKINETSDGKWWRSNFNTQKRKSLTESWTEQISIPSAVFSWFDFSCRLDFEPRICLRIGLSARVGREKSMAFSEKFIQWINIKHSTQTKIRIIRFLLNEELKNNKTDNSAFHLMQCFT